MNCGQRLAFFYAIADTGVEFEPDGVVDAVFFFLAAAAKHGESDAKLVAQVPVIKPRDGLRMRSTERAAGRRPGSSTTRSSPPCKRMHCLNFSLACPLTISDSASKRPSSTDFVRSPRKNIHAESSMLNSRRSGGPPPLRTSIHSATSTECPAMRPSG